MIGVGFEPTPPKRLVPKTSALDRSAIQPKTLIRRVRHSAKNELRVEAKRVFPVRELNPGLVGESHLS